MYLDVFEVVEFLLELTEGFRLVFMEHLVGDDGLAEHDLVAVGLQEDVPFVDPCGMLPVFRRE